MTSIGICTTRKSAEDLDYEKRRLYTEAIGVYDNVYLLNPRHITYKLIRGSLNPEVQWNGQRIETLNVLITGGTKGREVSTAFLARTLKMSGCNILDPIERYSVGRASKLLSTLTRFQSQTGTSTFIAFSHQYAQDLLTELHQADYFPLIAKPISGKKGTGITRLDSLQKARSYAQQFYAENPDEEPLYLQKYTLFTQEYRVLILNGSIIGTVQKHPQQGHIAANAAQGATFRAIDTPQSLIPALLHVSNQGLIGVDVAIDQDNQAHIIETNRAPLWEQFEQATQINVAKIIIDQLKENPSRII